MSHFFACTNAIRSPWIDNNHLNGKTHYYLLLIILKIIHLFVSHRPDQSLVFTATKSDNKTSAHDNKRPFPISQFYPFLTLTSDLFFMINWFPIIFLLIFCLFHIWDWFTLIFFVLYCFFFVFSFWMRKMRLGWLRSQD